MPSIVLQTVNTASKMQAIEIVQEITGVGSDEAKNVIESVQQGKPYTIADIPDERVSSVIKALESAGCTASLGGSSLAPRKPAAIGRIEYDLFGKPVVFSAAENRYLDLLCLEQDACLKSAARFSYWYQKCGGIETVLRQYLSFAHAVLEELVLRPLFQQLAEFEIYDISWETYVRECNDSSITSAIKQSPK